MKKTLLIAAAALVAGIVSSEAQVYSANVVGYVNQTAANGVFALQANPLDNGTNTLASLFPSVPPATTVQTWDPVAGSFTLYKFLAGHWKNGTVVSDTVQILPGQGFFITPGGSVPYTNTFVGNVVAAPGSSVTNTVGTGLHLVGSLVPYADYVTNTATINLPVAPATTLQTWDPIGQQFVLYKFLAGQWKIGTTPAVPQIAVGQGFFLSPPTVANVWVQTLP